MVRQRETVSLIKEVKQKAIADISKSKYDKVESRIGQATTAMASKKREKFNADRDQRKDAQTFGGNLLGVPMRVQPAWRKA